MNSLLTQKLIVTNKINEQKVEPISANIFDFTKDLSLLQLFEGNELVDLSVVLMIISYNKEVKQAVIKGRKIGQRMEEIDKLSMSYQKFLLGNGFTHQQGRKSRMTYSKLMQEKLLRQKVEGFDIPESKNLPQIGDTPRLKSTKPKQNGPPLIVQNIFIKKQRHILTSDGNSQIESVSKFKTPKKQTNTIIDAQIHGILKRPVDLKLNDTSIKNAYEQSMTKDSTRNNLQARNAHSQNSSPQKRAIKDSQTTRFRDPRLIKSSLKSYLLEIDIKFAGVFFYQLSNSNKNWISTQNMKRKIMTPISNNFEKNQCFTMSILRIKLICVSVINNDQLKYSQGSISQSERKEKSFKSQDLPKLSRLRFNSVHESVIEGEQNKLNLSYSVQAKEQKVNLLPTTEKNDCLSQSLDLGGKKTLILLSLNEKKARGVSNSYSHYEKITPIKFKRDLTLKDHVICLDEYKKKENLSLPKETVRTRSIEQILEKINQNNQESAKSSSGLPNIVKVDNFRNKRTFNSSTQKKKSGSSNFIQWHKRRVSDQFNIISEQIRPLIKTYVDKTGLNMDGGNQSRNGEMVLISPDAQRMGKKLILNNIVVDIKDSGIKQIFWKIANMNERQSIFANARITRANLKEYLLRRYELSQVEKFVNFLEVQAKMDFRGYLGIVERLLNLNWKERVMFCFMGFDLNEDGLICNGDMFLWLKKCMNRMAERDMNDIVRFAQSKLGDVRNQEDNEIEKIFVKKSLLKLSEYRALKKKGLDNEIPKIKKDTLYCSSFQMIEHFTKYRHDLNQLEDVKLALINRDNLSSISSPTNKNIQNPTLSVNKTFEMDFDTFEILMAQLPHLPFLYFDLLAYLSLIIFSNVQYTPYDAEYYASFLDFNREQELFKSMYQRLLDEHNANMQIISAQNKTKLRNRN